MHSRLTTAMQCIEIVKNGKGNNTAGTEVDVVTGAAVAFVLAFVILVS